jgi:hypothetical protein
VKNVRFALAILMVLPALAVAQAPPLGLLSPHAGVPDAGRTPGGGGATAAGMPLRDGSLAPGMVTVRVVRGSFDNNVANQEVALTAAGGKTQTARTDDKGRAQFAHQVVGSSVQATATVNGETLKSEAFNIPAESGVRLLLVVGDGPVTAAGPVAALPAPLAGPLAPEGEATQGVAVPGGPSSGTTDDTATITAIRVVMTVMTLLGFAFVGFRRPRRS